MAAAVIAHILLHNTIVNSCTDAPLGERRKVDSFSYSFRRRKWVRSAERRDERAACVRVASRIGSRIHEALLKDKYDTNFHLRQRSQPPRFKSCKSLKIPSILAASLTKQACFHSSSPRAWSCSRRRLWHLRRR